MSLELKTNILPKNKTKVEEIIQKVMLNEKSLILSDFKIEYEKNELCFYFRNTLNSESFQMLHVLLEKITYLYSSKRYDKVSQKDQPYFTVDDDITFIVENKDYEKIKKERDPVKRFEIIDGKEVYIHYIKNKEYNEAPLNNRNPLYYMFNTSENKKLKYVNFIINT